jgi:hypothetical protein
MPERRFFHSVLMGRERTIDLTYSAQGCCNEFSGAVET